MAKIAIFYFQFVIIIHFHHAKHLNETNLHETDISDQNKTQPSRLNSYIWKVALKFKAQAIAILELGKVFL